MLPLVGSIEVAITGVLPVLIHGDRYCDLAIESEGRRAAVRVPLHVCSRLPEVGDRVRLKVLLGTVDGMEFLS